MEQNLFKTNGPYFKWYLDAIPFPNHDSLELIHEVIMHGFAPRNITVNRTFSGSN